MGKLRGGGGGVCPSHESVPGRRRHAKAESADEGLPKFAVDVKAIMSRHGQVDQQPDRTDTAMQGGDDDGREEPQMARCRASTSHVGLRTRVHGTYCAMWTATISIGRVRRYDGKRRRIILDCTARLVVRHSTVDEEQAPVRPGMHGRPVGSERRSRTVGTFSTRPFA
ncbi:hypothetical protein DCS_05910 [Drechmeria coniospora]|uniref:Uncharacterized protein n=1 Tax=Drechmeria coniospora TaxID=98403 RepID=A0A151GA46_DRECN|nr:hypothetical protein DCS_05910 [Drechmeria coniospora]KYK53961.1 hypothetical protein DCS_05910 [Drechmeria coniospora]